MKKNIILPSQTDRSHRAVFWIKNKKPNWRKLNQKDADDNPVYRAFKNQRDAKTILSFILGQVETKKPLLLNYRSKSHMEQPLNSCHSQQKYKKSKSVNPRQTFRERAAKIMTKSKKMSQQLEYSKRRISILNRFNNRVDKYCNSIPRNHQQDEQDLNFANEDLMKLCDQDLFPTQDLFKKASSFIHYQEPKIPQTKLKKLKEKYRLNTATSGSHTEPFARLLSLNSLNS